MSDSIKIAYSSIFQKIFFFNQCYTFDFIDTQRPTNDYQNRSQIDYFSRGIGLVRSCGLWQGAWFRVLINAKINGQIVLALPSIKPGLRQNILVKKSSNIHSGIYSINGRKITENANMFKKGVNASAGIHLDPKIGLYIVN